MEVFEFYFNPSSEKEIDVGLTNSIFESFYYEPENIYEKRLGSFFTVGLLKKVLPHNIKFLEKLSKFIKEEYYKKTLIGPEKSLKEALKQANGFLEQITKKGDVSWLGNLDFAVLTIKNFTLNFTKTGDIKILLLRNKKIIDLDKKIKFKDIEPYPLRIFGNIVSGKFDEDDLILVLTKDIFNFFQQENLINDLSLLKEISIKEIKKIFNTKKENLEKVSGVCLMILLKKEILGKKKEIISSPSLKEFSFKEFFSPILKHLPKNFKKIYLSPINFSKTKISKNIFYQLKSKLNKKLVLFVSLIIVLIFGFLITNFLIK